MEITILVAVVAALIILSAVCSGLNVAIVSLNLADMERKAKLGNKSAQRVLALRRNSHLSLASILLINVAVISTTSLILENRFNGWVAGIGTTLLIVVFGEIIPQAVFTRHALKFTSYSAPLLRAMIVITYPISKPLQLLLDKMIGHEERQLESRRELGLLVTQHIGHKSSDLDEDEIEIIKGALSLSEKDVRHIMTPIDKVYSLVPSGVINQTKYEQVRAVGHSRIPVISNAKDKFFGIILMRDIISADPAKQPVRVADLPIRPVPTVGSMTALDTMFRKFINAKTHFIAVERNSKIVGVVTMEDLIEEIIGHEIDDELYR